MRIIADRAVCAGHGMCEALAPDLFQVGADGVVVAADTEGADRELLELVVDSCPVGALRLG
ncbi:ferredoxin [Nocardia sp. CDC186]|uniref:Ferredoxin n=1 Tax=Nocardia implantans TaxID=3108168 RepID=A0ABU6B0P2_9NOCA|nr:MULTISPECIES: ferredoxin [unclassified Nocardia]MBF6195346.1 ferredoxin [Nocardia beijingensis]MEA3528739.1 ferredoxin [Nocardia sp. CDC192]MEB3513265.1 ferredoxin [Nocardia sp. CDC186]